MQKLSAVIGGAMLLFTVSANAQVTCSGEFEGDAKTGFGVGGCVLSAANAKKVMKVCTLGQQCEITGTTDHCKGVRGACAEMIDVKAIKWGKPLPPCTDTSASARADQWWSENSTVLVRGTIVPSATREDKVDSPPYGHIKIIVDLTTCSNGSPMAVDRVPEGWIGHYVEIGGNAMKAANGWYIIARSIKDVEK